MRTTVGYDGDTFTLESFIEQSDFITDIDYNIVNFVPGTQIDFQREDEEDQFESLFVDGIKIEYDHQIVKIHEYSYKFTIPNDSVKRRADNLTKSISKHRRIDPYTKKPDFDVKDYLDKPVDEQLTAVIDYLRDRIALDHFIHYEIMVYSMTRDADNNSERVTRDTKNIDFIQTGDICLYPDRNKSIALSLPYGWIKLALEKVYSCIEPDEYDLLYSNLLNKSDNADDTYRTMNKILGEGIAKNDEYYNEDEGILKN